MPIMWAYYGYYEGGIRMKVYIVIRIKRGGDEIVKVFSDKKMADKLVNIRKAMGEFVRTREWKVFEPSIRHK